MPWGRYRIGNVRDGGLVHFLYEWFKDERIHWDTQCNIQWGSRDNTSRDLKPRMSKKPITCVECIVAQIQIGAPW
jgi:hypothetical protein